VLVATLQLWSKPQLDEPGHFLQGLQGRLGPTRALQLNVNTLKEGELL
jgi:hypothetical protein